MKQREEDLVLGKSKEGDEPEDDGVTMEDLMANIDTAQATYEFIDGIDLEGPEVLTWGLSDEMADTKRKCLEIIIKNISILHAL